MRARHAVTSAGKFLGMNTITGEDGSPYMTRAWIGRLRLHIFHRPDHDPDCHDHPWDFWTLPIWPPHGYVEEVVTGQPMPGTVDEPDPDTLKRMLQIVPAFWPSYREATHCHRVLGAYVPAFGQISVETTVTETGDQYFTGSNIINPKRKIVTFVWRGKAERKWGFLKNRNGEWCWIAWRDYVFGGGKDGPCQ